MIDYGAWCGLKKGKYKIAEGVDQRLTEFQKNWEAIIEEWANLGGCWGRGEPRFPDEFVISYTKYINSFGGVITWEFLPPSEDGNIKLLKSTKKLGTSNNIK